MPLSLSDSCHDAIVYAPARFEASCERYDGSVVSRTVDLDEFLGNDDGTFSTRTTRFSQSAREVRISGFLLSALLRKRDGRWIRATIDLESVLVNHDGQLCQPGDVMEESNLRATFGEQLQVSLKLRRFSLSDELAEDDDRLPSTWLYGHAVAADFCADPLMHHPEVVETVIKGLVGLYETFKARPAQPAPANRAAQTSSLASFVVEPIIRLCIKYAKPAKSWAESKKKEFNEEQSKATLAQHSAKLQPQCQNIDRIFARFKDRASRLVLEPTDIELAGNLLILVGTYSKEAIKASQKVVNDKKAKFTAPVLWATVLGGAVLCLGAAPAIPLTALGAPAIASQTFVAFGSFTAFSVGSIASIRKAIPTGKEWQRAKQHMDNAKVSAEELETGIKACCIFLCFLYNVITSLQQLNDEAFVKQVRKLNETLPRNIEEWSNPRYVKTYLDKEGSRLSEKAQELHKHIEALLV